MAKKTDKNRGGGSIKEMLRSRLGRYLTLFLVSAWMFVLGVLVGRGTAPVRFDLGSLDAELAALKDKERQMARAKVEPQTVDPKTDLEFYEELKKTPKPPETKARPPTASPKPEPQKPPPKVVAKPVVKQASEPSKSDAEKDRPAGSATAEKGSAADRQNQTGGLTVQAASLKDPKDADDLVSRLKKKGYPAYKTIAVVPEQGIWFRVRVGWFDSREEADGTLKGLKKDGFDPFLVRTEK